MLLKTNLSKFTKNAVVAWVVANPAIVAIVLGLVLALGVLIYFVGLGEKWLALEPINVCRR